MKLPGTKLLAVARLIIDPNVVSRVLEPLVADWQREWLASDTPARRLRVRLRGCGAFFRSAAYCVVIDGMPVDVRRRTWSAFAVFVGIGTLVLSIPYAWVPFEVPFELTPYLLPSTLALSIPFALLPLAMLLGTSRNRHGNRRHLARFTMAIALLVFVLHNWVTPSANQAFREHVVSRMAERAGKVAEYRPPRRGLGEMTLSEVFAMSVSTPGAGAIASPSKVREELFRRITLPLVPVLLAFMGWGLTRVSSSAGAMRLVGWWVFAGVTYGFGISLGMILEREWSTPRELAIWLPLILWALASAALMRETATRGARQA